MRVHLQFNSSTPPVHLYWIDISIRCIRNGVWSDRPFRKRRMNNSFGGQDEEQCKWSIQELEFCVCWRLIWKDYNRSIDSIENDFVNPESAFIFELASERIGSIFSISYDPILFCFWELIRFNGKGNKKAWTPRGPDINRKGWYWKENCWGAQLVVRSDS